MSWLIGTRPDATLVKRFGRPSVLSEEQQSTVIARINAGISISAIAREFNTTRQTILRVKAGK
ncbi:helix-turn-helix domain-containing protein [Salmonella enterica]|nr:helix-turn-helix domain-containing protein [Salmonella enterica]